MPITATVSWPTFPAGVPVTLARLRRAPGISLAGSVTAGDLAAGAVTPAKVTPGAYWYAAGTLSGNNYLATLSPALSAYATGVVVAFRASSENPVAATGLNVNSLGAKVIYKHKEQPLVVGDIRNNQIVCVRYDAALNSAAGGWQMMSPPGNSPTRYATTSSLTFNPNVQELDFGGSTGYNTIKALSAAVGVPLWFKAGVTNTGPLTLNVDGLNPTAVKKAGTAALGGGDVVIGEIYCVVYDGTNFQLLNPSSRPLLKAWAKFNGAPTTKSVTNARPAADQLTVTGHGITAATSLATVQAVAVKNTGGGLHAGLVANTIYFAYVMDGNTLKLSTTVQGGFDGTSNMVAITGDGTGTNTMDYITINACYGVNGVIARSTAGSLTTGVYDVYWESAFSSAHYAVTGCAKGASAANSLVFAVDNGDTGSASLKRVMVENLSGTNVNSDEVYIMAAGTQV